MEIVPGFLIALIAIAVVLFPFRRIKRRPHSRIQQRLEELQAQRQAVYEDLGTSQLEHELGSITRVNFSDRLKLGKYDIAVLLKEEAQIGIILRAIEKTLEEEIEKTRLEIETKTASCNPEDTQESSAE